MQAGSLAAEALLRAAQPGSARFRTAEHSWSELFQNAKTVVLGGLNGGLNRFNMLRTSGSSGATWPGSARSSSIA
jgi:hypothetical protein